MNSLLSHRVILSALGGVLLALLFAGCGEDSAAPKPSGSNGAAVAATVNPGGSSVPTEPTPPMVAPQPIDPSLVARSGMLAPVDPASEAEEAARKARQAAYAAQPAAKRKSFLEP